MKIAIAGGTGFVGSALTEYLLSQNHEVYILTRSSAKSSSHRNLSYVEWLQENSQPEQSLNNIDAFINLAGESISSGRWTEQRKRRILETRINSTRAIIDILSKLETKPSVFINASAVGYYGVSLNEAFTEKSTIHGSDFLAQTVKSWEDEAQKASSLGIRTVLCRFGIILGKNEGALPRILLPYKLFIGGTVGSGEQWLSWVHIEDVVHMIEFAILNKQLSGTVNVTAPNPVKMNEFGKTIAETMNRPHWLPAPSFALKYLLGEMSMIVLEGQKALPNKLQQFGYHFSYSHLNQALKNLIKS